MSEEYIKRSSLIEDIKKAQSMLVSNDDIEWQMNKQYYNGLAWAHGLILSAPAENVQEVKTGEWINEPPYRTFGGEYLKAQECSVCGALFISDGYKPYSNHPYCAQCGAHMKPATNDCGVTYE